MKQTEIPQGDLKSCEALKAYARKVMYEKNATNFSLIKMFDEIIDNAPPATDHSVEIAQKSIELGRRVGRAEEAIKNPRPQGKWYECLDKGLLKARHGNYVVYDVDYLLDNLAREVNIMESVRQMRGGDGE